LFNIKHNFHRRYKSRKDGQSEDHHKCIRLAMDIFLVIYYVLGFASFSVNFVGMLAPQVLGSCVKSAMAYEIIHATGKHNNTLY